MTSSSSFILNSGPRAFGDGSHPSTMGALAALEALGHFHGVRTVLDMGCGSGILALQAAYQWHASVLAVDIEAESVAATTENAAKNQLQDLVLAVQSDGFAHPLIRQKAPFDVIIANILAEKLIDMAYDITAHLSDEGIVLLSGILSWRTQGVEEAFASLGLSLLQRYKVQDWVCLLWQKQTGE